MKRYFKPVAKPSAPSASAAAPLRGSAQASVPGANTPAGELEAERDRGTVGGDGGMRNQSGAESDSAAERGAIGEAELVARGDMGARNAGGAGDAGAGGRIGGAKRSADAATCGEQAHQSAPSGEQAQQGRVGGAKRSADAMTCAEQAPQRAANGEQVQSGSSKPQEPIRIMSWNANSLLLRLRHNRAELVGFISRYDPDVIAIQEVRMAAAGRKGAPLNQSELKDDTKQAREERQFLQHALSSPPFSHYRVWWSLAATKYAGTAMLLKRSLLPSLLGVSYSLDASSFQEGTEPRMQQQRPQHEADGRAVILDFPSYRLLNTYVPNNGFSKDSPSFPRRRQWDDRIRRFLSSDAVRSKPLIWLGDLNVSATEDDVSDPEFFRMATNGEPAIDPGDRGQPGFSINERLRFAETLKCTGLTDAYRHLHPSKDMQGGFTWCGNQVGKYRGKRMRVDYFCVPETLLPRVATSDIHGRGFEGEGFLGSDHCPITLTLQPI